MVGTIPGQLRIPILPGGNASTCWPAARPQRVPIEARLDSHRSGLRTMWLQKTYYLLEVAFQLSVHGLQS